MKHLWVFIFALLILGCQKKDAPKGGTEFSLDGFVTEKIEGTNFMSATRTNAAGILTDEGILKNGKQHGPWKAYEPNRGYMESITYFSDGEQMGPVLKFDSRGTVIEEASYLDGELHGKTVKYRYGLKIAERNYKMGKPDGKQYDFYDNGKIMQIAEFKDGVQDGLFEYYTFEGEKQMSYQYKNGQKIAGGLIDESKKEKK
ncbi:MAG TPA: hypothetical protein PLU49_06350 [Saprospiraceae bacterium]|mgnify:CR=1 FL=1|nr:hypothetical protein [Saprospirales bacterium]HRQ29678.1 hypothetical protein [Saprospiraceae bacterium]